MAWYFLASLFACRSVESPEDKTLLAGATELSLETVVAEETCNVPIPEQPIPVNPEEVKKLWRAIMTGECGEETKVQYPSEFVITRKKDLKQRRVLLEYEDSSFVFVATYDSENITNPYIQLTTILCPIGFQRQYLEQGVCDPHALFINDFDANGTLDATMIASTREQVQFKGKTYSLNKETRSFDDVVPVYRDILEEAEKKCSQRMRDVLAKNDEK